MLTEKRQQLILERLKIDHIISIKNLVKLTNSSESTIRRDLNDLENQKLLVRVHGGVESIDSSLRDEPKNSQRMHINMEEKTKIAEYAASLIKENEVIFLDAGTTTSAMIPYLSHFQHLMVITNGVDNASKLIDYQISTIVLGGKVRALTKAAVGTNIVSYLKNCHLDRAFVGTNGFDVEHGYSTPDPEEAAVKSMAIKQSGRAYVLSDNSKLKQNRFRQFADLNDAELITNSLNKKDSGLLSKYTNIMEVNNL